MQKIWEGYIDGSIAIDKKIATAYSERYKVPEMWIETSDYTIKEHVDKCIESLQLAGFNLDTTPLEYLEEIFLKLEVKITAPPEYIQLSQSLNDITEQIEVCQKNNIASDVLNKLFSTKEKIEIALKDMVK